MTVGHVSDLFSMARLQDEVTQKFVRSQRHPSLPYTIYNYTERAQFEQRWNRVTLNCRGLILDDAGVIIARPFPKFFNYNDANDPYEHNAWGGVRVTDKLDGSLGIAYNNPAAKCPFMATRGSFASDQAVRANRILTRKYPDWVQPEGFTTLFEIVYPENRIVLNYGDVEDLYLLGYVDNETGLSYSAHQLNDTWTGPRASSFTFGSLSEALSAPARVNAEGYVVHFHGSDTRVKIKQQDYLDLHRVVTNLNARRVWQDLVDDPATAVETLCAALPDEFHGWVREVAHQLGYEVVNWQTRVDDEFEGIIEVLNEWHPGWNRGDFAAKARQTTIAGWLFLKLDSQEDRLYDAIWQAVKPSSDWTPSHGA